MLPAAIPDRRDSIIMTLDRGEERPPAMGKRHKLQSELQNRFTKEYEVLCVRLGPNSLNTLQVVSRNLLTQNAKIDAYVTPRVGRSSAIPH